MGVRNIAASVFRWGSGERTNDKQGKCSHTCYRLWAVDGTELPIFRDPNSDSFIVTPTNPRGYNALHANIIHDINNSVFVDRAMGRDEQGQLLALIYRRKFTEPTILVMDRGHESYNTIAHCCNIPNFFLLCMETHDMMDLAAVKKNRQIEIWSRSVIV